MKIIFALLSGLVFGFGLVVSGMSNPSKVLNFLDVAGSFDPSLMFVMSVSIGKSELRKFGKSELK